MANPGLGVAAALTIVVGLILFGVVLGSVHDSKQDVIEQAAENNETPDRSTLRLLDTVPVLYLIVVVVIGALLGFFSFKN